MRNLLAVAALVVAIPALAKDVSPGPMQRKLQDAKAVVWGGIDYSAARIFVPEKFNDDTQITFFDPGGGLDDAVRRYGKPDDAWKDLQVEWNEMLQNIMVKSIEETIQRDIVIDLPAPEGQTKRSPPYFESQYEAKNNTEELDEEKIKAMVKKYRFKTKEGIALVYIVERFAAVEKEACIWRTFIELPKKEVMEADRICEKPGGVTFRNYWLGPLVDVGKDMVKAMKKGEF